MIDHVRRERVSFHADHVKMFRDRALPNEEIYVSLSFSPIFGEGNSVDGLFCICTETTDAVVRARRTETLYGLGAASGHRTIDAMCDAVRDVLAKNPDDIPFAALVLNDDHPRTAIAVRIAPEDPAFVRMLDDDLLELATLTELAVEVGPITRAVAVPIYDHAEVRAVLVCGVSPHRPLDAQHRAFFDLASVRIGNALAHAESRANAGSRVSREKDDFLAVIGHELRNPLSTMLVTLDVLARQTPSIEVTLLDRAARQLTRLVDDLLDLSRLHRGKLVLHQTTVEISEVVDQTIARASRALEERNLQVFVRVPRTGLGVTCDPERIAQVFGNVLSNAVKYSSSQGRITIEAQRTDDRVKIIIRDEGAGIDADHLARILEPFRALVAEHSGLGLGLAIARELLELHSGTINVASEGVGHGTTVTIELPATRPDSQVAPRQKARRLRVLLVEDNHDTALALQHALETLGYEVALAHNGPVALTVARSFEPEVALLDINLPVMDGWELSHRLRNVKVKGRNLPVIAVTARDQDQDKQRSADAGFAGHLVKPIDLTELERLVEQLSAPPTDQ